MTVIAGRSSYEVCIEHQCDQCKEIIKKQMYLHWEDKDFSLCSTCLMELYQQVFEPFSRKTKDPIEDKNTGVYKKTPIPKDIRWRIWVRDEFTCQYCGVREDLSVDHIVPESAGGKTIETNLVTACKKCNSKKNKRTPEEAGMPLRNDPRE